MHDPDNRSVSELLALSRDCCPDVVPLPEQFWIERGVFLGGMRVIGFSHVLRVLDLREVCRSLQYARDWCAICSSYLYLDSCPQHRPLYLPTNYSATSWRSSVNCKVKPARWNSCAICPGCRCTGETLPNLDISLLPPLLCRPISHVLPPFSELQDNICLVSPLSSQPRARQALVSAVLPLAHVDLPPRDHPFVQYVEWHLPISVSVLVQQLKAVTQLFLALPASKPSTPYLQDLEHVIREIYSHLDEQLARSPDLSEVLQRNVSGTEHVIWTGTTFAAPNQVALRCELQIKPWAMKVPKFAAQFKHLTEHVGFMKEFGAEHYCRILSELHAQYGGSPLSAKHLKQVQKIVRHLSAEILRHGADHVPLDHVLVPNSAGVLKSARTVMYQSRDSTALGNHVLSHDLVHAEIVPEWCRALGIAPADKLLLQSCIKPFGRYY